MLLTIETYEMENMLQIQMDSNRWIRKWVDKMNYRDEAVKCVNQYVLPEMKRQFVERLQKFLNECSI